MLDFYLVSSAADGSAEYPDAAKHLGGLSREQHQALDPVLNACKPVGIVLPHYEDTAFTAPQVQAWLACLRANQPLASSTAAAAAFAILESLVSAAAERRCGLRSFCD